MDYSKKFELEVHGKNECIKAAKLALQQLIPQFKEKIGKKIMKANGSFSKKGNHIIDKPAIEKELTPFTENGYVKINSCYCDVVHYNNHLRLYMKLVICGGSYDDKSYYCEYFEIANIDFGTVYDGELFHINTVEEAIENDYRLIPIDKDEQLGYIKQYQELKKQLDEVEKRIDVAKEIYKYM